MAEFEELRINVKTSPEKVSEQIRSLQEFFRTAGGVEHVQHFEKLGRQFKLTDNQIKELSEAIGKSQGPLQAFMTGFGKGGAILLAFEVALRAARAVADDFTRVSRQHIEIQQLAMRMGGVHAAQLEENIRTMERNKIERGQAMALQEKFAENMLKFKDKATGFYQDLLKKTPEEFQPIIQRHFQELRNTSDISEQMNLIKHFADEIFKYYEQHPELGGAERGAAERKAYLEYWMGVPDLMYMTEDFKTVTQEQKELWDRQQQAVDKYWRVTADISQNLDDIIRGFLHTTFEDLGINTGLIALDSWLKRQADRSTAHSALTPEQRAQYQKDINAFIEKYKKEHGFFAFLRDIVLKDLLTMGGGLAHTEVPMPTPVAPQHFLGDYSGSMSELLTVEKRLLDNVALLNSMIAGGQATIVIGRSDNLTYHNAPMGGAKGESNPIQLPIDASQPGGGASTEARKGLPPLIDIPDYRGRAAVRYNNPGAQFPASEAYAFGMYGYSKLLGGKYKIAAFPDAVHGAASNMELFSRAFTGKQLGPAGDKWTGGLGFGVPGYDPKMIVTKDMMDDPNFAIPFMKSLSHREVGGKYPMTEEQWKQAHDLYLARGNESLVDLKKSLSTSDYGPVEGRSNEPSDTSQTQLAQRTSASQGWHRMRQFLAGGNYGTAEYDQALMSPIKSQEWQMEEQGSRVNDEMIMRAKEAQEKAGSEISLDRRAIDRQMKDEIDVGGKLNVKVNAPSGTSVKAEGAGLLKDVTVDRSMDSDFAGAP